MLPLARLIRVRGIVQGVGFRPFAYRLARRYALAGWVSNGNDGVAIHVEGADSNIEAFVQALETETPPAATIAALEIAAASPGGYTDFAIRTSAQDGTPTVRISPDLATCAACLHELFDRADRRYRYPYINCTDCGPRYSIVRALPYDRVRTTMAGWTMCAACQAEYDDPGDRRFHAQPIACHACGPQFYFEADAATLRGDRAIVAAAGALANGRIVAIKGIGGYHLACDALDARAVAALRERKFRKERPFAVMACDVATAERLAVFDPAARALLTSAARPIVLAPAREPLAGIAPDNRELGVMLGYTPLHALLFASGAPATLVLTSANRSSEPIAYDDDEARTLLAGIADALLVGERPIARRVDDTIVRTQFGTPSIVRRSRGYAPQTVARVAATQPILAVGGDLKNAVALVIGGTVLASQHVGDLAHYGARAACIATLRDLCAAYQLDPAQCLIAHDAHPEYASTAIAHELSLMTVAVQHHRAHIAGVLAERSAYTTEVIGIAFDGTGYGDDGTIWGGECLTGSVATGFERIAHLRPAKLPGGDAAARFPVQSAAGFLYELDGLPDLSAAPFHFPPRYDQARQLVESDVRTFATTSIGRLFDAAAAICGYTRETTFEGQAAMWLEHQAAAAHDAAVRLPFPFRDAQLDYRPLLETLVRERQAGRPVPEVALAFHVAVANAVQSFAALRSDLPVVASGGVFANRLLCELVHERLGDRLWLAQAVPCNDGGLCVGQAVLAAYTRGISRTDLTNECFE